MLTEQARAYFNEMFPVYLDDLDLPGCLAIKNIIYNVMPETCKGDFVHSNQKITNISLASLVSYMDAVRQPHDSSKT